MAEFLQQLDPSKLVIVGSALSLVTSAFTAPSYNLPIFLFGTYVSEATEAAQSLQTFVAATAASMVLDIIFLSRNEQNWFIKLITIVILILKLPTFLVFGQALRQRGPGLGGLGINAGDLSGPTVWSMPGGFTSGGREGYQNVDEEPQARAPPPRSAAPRSTAPPPAPASDHSAPGAYQSV
ncbi:hypothetical protein FIBSPDRAFT_1037785 [Athelia psychrophila]|uniref:Uncharacterized protein n=1 Tax=Athelia psychrophila TaxID=1759441 RepID=A0A166U5M2_9AGAM|nr:hypothetical protein FIBSPDRAFT_1037785 [Fibularhizoctonia sp. CBS 109695]